MMELWSLVRTLLFIGLLLFGLSKAYGMYHMASIQGKTLLCSSINQKGWTLPKLYDSWDHFSVSWLALTAFQYCDEHWESSKYKHAGWKEFEIIVCGNFTQAVGGSQRTLDHVDGQPNHFLWMEWKVHGRTLRRRQGLVMQEQKGPEICILTARLLQPS